jgi:alpha-acetolactate decarboxylase
MHQVIRESVVRFAGRLCTIAGVIVLLALSGCAGPPKEHRIIFKYSSINALLEGVYDSDLTVSELAAHGNFGIGTFDGLDGEMIAKAGGHVLELQTDMVTARIEGVHEFHMVLPHNRPFYHSDLTKGKKGELEKVEKAGGSGLH